MNRDIFINLSEHQGLKVMNILTRMYCTLKVFVMMKIHSEPFKSIIFCYFLFTTINGYWIMDFPTHTKVHCQLSLSKRQNNLNYSTKCIIYFQLHCLWLEKPLCVRMYYSCKCVTRDKEKSDNGVGKGGKVITFSSFMKEDVVHYKIIYRFMSTSGICVCSTGSVDVLDYTVYQLHYLNL